MGHSPCGTIGRVVRGIVAEVFQGFPLCRQNCTIDSLGCNVGEFVMLGHHIFANEVMGTWTCGIIEGFQIHCNRGSSAIFILQAHCVISSWI